MTKKPKSLEHINIIYAALENASNGQDGTANENYTKILSIYRSIGHNEHIIKKILTLGTKYLIQYKTESKELTSSNTPSPIMPSRNNSDDSQEMDSFYEPSTLITGAASLCERNIDESHE